MVYTGCQAFHLTLHDPVCRHHKGPHSSSPCGLISAWESNSDTGICGMQRPQSVFGYINVIGTTFLEIAGKTNTDLKPLTSLISWVIVAQTSCSVFPLSSSRWRQTLVIRRTWNPAEVENKIDDSERCQSYSIMTEKKHTNAKNNSTWEDMFDDFPSQIKIKFHVKSWFYPFYIKNPSHKE